MSNNRSNNGRIVPDAVTDNKMEVVSTPVNKLRTYRPDLAEASKTKATYQGLASLGQGMMNVSGTLRQTAGEEIFAAYEKTAEKNRQDWKEVSKNIKGMAKFNPYNKDAYNQIHSAQVYRQVYNEVLAAPELEKKSSEEIDALFEGQHQKAIQMLEERGVDVKNYAALQIDFDNKLAHIKHQYASDNAKYNYELFKNKSSSDMAYALYESVGSASNTPKPELLQNVLTDKCTTLKEVGTPADTQAEIIMNSLSNAIAIDPSKFTSADLLALRTFKIEGKSLEELVPHYGAKVQQMVREAKSAALQEKKIDYDSYNFNQQQLMDKASDEALAFLTSNPNADMRTQQQYFLQLAKKYELDGNHSFSFFNSVASGRKSIADLKKVPSDENTRLGLQLKMNDGSLTNGDISKALNDGKLSVDDALTLYRERQTLETKQQNQYSKKVDEHIKRTQDMYFGDKKKKQKNGAKALCQSQEARVEMSNAIAELRGKFEQEVLVNPEQAYKNFNNDLALLKTLGKHLDMRKGNELTIKALKHYQPTVNKIASGRASGFEHNVSNTRPQSMTRAFKSLGLFHTTDGKGKDYNVGVLSSPSLSRPDPTNPSRANRHVGYDLSGAYGGRPVYVNKGGTVVYVSRATQANKQNGGAGNTVIVQTPDGKYARFMHLQYANLPVVGTTLTKDTPVGHVGNTGKTTGNCLHVEFYDSNGNWIPVEKF